MADVSNVSNVKYLPHYVSKNTSQYIFYMCQIFTICVRTIANFQRYEHKCQMKKIIFYSTFLSPLNSLFDFFSIFSKSISLPSSQPVFFLFSQLDTSKKPIYGAKEGNGGGQERRKGSRDFVEIDGSSDIEFAERSGDVHEWGWGASDF